MDEFIKERNEALMSEDKEKIIAYCKKYKIDIPENEEIFWAGVYKSLCNLFLLKDSPISIEQYNKSYDWLIVHDFSPYID